MAIQAWKRFEKTDSWQRVKTRVKRLVGKELRLEPEVDVPITRSGGWEYDATRLDEFSIVYSVGVGDDIVFDLAVIKECDSNVYAFDPTPGSQDFVDIQDPPAKFSFYAWGVAAQDGSLALYPRVRKSGELSEVMYTMVPDESSENNAIEVPCYTIASIAGKLGHSRIDLLKLDIEGAEYEVLDGLLASPIRPTQLLVEFHHRFFENGLERTAENIDRLQDAGYKIMSVRAESGREIGFLYVP
ncbi:MAG: FkbM family methyltransferase [Woeseiaceae bacterium]